MPSRPKAAAKSSAAGAGSATAEPSLSSVPADGEPTPNVAYMTRITEAWNAVKEAMPEITTSRALPVRASEAATEGPLAGLTGFSEPWSQALYDDKHASLTKTSGMACALALANHEILGSLTPWIPFDEDRVRQLIPMLFDTPRRFPYVVTVPVDFGPACGLPSSPMTICLPLEVMHALIFAIADRVGKPSWSTAEQKQWYQVLLSIPCLLVRIDTHDDRYIEAMNKRTELFATSIVTKLTVD